MQPSHPTLIGLRVNELTGEVDKKGQPRAALFVALFSLSYDLIDGLMCG